MTTIFKDLNIFYNVKPKKVDLVITTVPYTETTLPLMAPAILKSIAKDCRVSSVGLDLNYYFVDWLQYRSDKNKFLDFFHTEKIDANIEDVLNRIHEYFVFLLLAHRPKIIALSLLSVVCQASCKRICQLLRKHKPDIKIVIGGAGCFENLNGHAMFAEELLNSGLIDHYIRGDGEKAFAAYLKGQYDFPGINNSDWQEITKEELDTFPYPDYDDYNFEHQHVIAINGSRGCVRRCKFCDIIEHWKKFNYRSGQSIFDEMIAQNKKYGIQTFKFQDSLVNGNLKEFKKLISLLADYNENNPDNKLRWSGYFIFRSKTSFGEDWWSLMEKSGANTLVVGIESLVESIRIDMGKNFTNEDLEYSLSMIEKYHLKMIMLMIVGWITETEKDIEYAKKWFIDNQKYKDLMIVEFGQTLGIYPNTWLDRNKDQLNIIKLDSMPENWKSLTNNSNPTLRAEWHKALSELCENLGYTLSDSLITHYLLERIIRNDTEFKNTNKYLHV